MKTSKRFRALAALALGWGLAPGLAGAAMRPVDCWFSVPATERAECGSVDIPSAGASPPAQLAVVILKARTTAPANDPVLFIEGGPGASPFGLSEEGEERIEAWWSLTAAMRRKRDVILFDPRGVGRSVPNADCVELDELAAGPTPATKAQRDQIEEAAERACAERLAGQGFDATAMGTPLAASDAFAIARAVDAKSVNLFAVSYGTRVAFAMMREPELPIRSVVLDGVYPPDVNAREEAAWLAQRGLRHLFEDCAGNRICRAAHPDLEARFLAQIRQLLAKPAEVRVLSAGPPQRIAITAGVTLEALLTAMTQGDALAELPDMADRVARGRFMPLLPWLRSSWFGDPDTADGLALSIECRETVNTADPKQVLSGLKRFEPFGAVLDEDPAIRLCGAWPSSVSMPAERLPVASPAPTLLLSGAYDTVTPPEWGDRAAATLPKSRHVVFRSLGHIVTMAKTCPMGMASDFIDDPNPAALRICAEAARPPVFNAR